MEKIDDLNGAGEMFVGDVPDPLGAVADHDFFLRAVPAMIPGVQVHASAEFSGGFNGSGVGGRIRIAKRIALWVPRRLRETASQLDLARLGRQSLLSAFSALRSGHRYSRAVALDIENRNRLPQHHREIPLHRPTDTRPPPTR